MSKPHVHTNNELAEDLAAQITERLHSKSAKPYPPGTVLIVNCVANGLILPDEWNDAIERVSKAQMDLPRSVPAGNDDVSYSDAVRKSRRHASSRQMDPP